MPQTIDEVCDSVESSELITFTSMSEAFDEFVDGADECGFANENINWPGKDELLSVAKTAIDAASDPNNMNFPVSFGLVRGTDSARTLDNWGSMKLHMNAKKKNINNAFIIDCLNNIDKCCPFDAPTGDFRGDICDTLTYDNPTNVALKTFGSLSTHTGREDVYSHYADKAIDGTTTCDSEIYESYPNYLCPQRDELGVFNEKSVDWCKARCNADSSCTSFEHRAWQSRQQKAICRLSSSCFRGLAVDVAGDYAGWTLYQKNDCFAMSGSGEPVDWKLAMKDDNNYKIRKVVVWAPQDAASVDMEPFVVNGWRSVIASSSTWTTSGGTEFLLSANPALNENSGWKAEIDIADQEVEYLNRIYISKSDGNKLRLAEVQVFTIEVLTPSTLPSKEDYQAAILTAMQNRVNEVTSDVEACYNQECG